MKKLLLILLLAAVSYYVYSNKLYEKIPLPGGVTKVGQGLMESGKQALDQGRRVIAEKGAEALKSGAAALDKEADPCRLRMVSLAAHLDGRLSEAGNRKSFTSKFLFGGLEETAQICPEDEQKYKIRLFKAASGYGYSITCQKREHELKSDDFRSGAWQAWVKG
ncbi:hypothetical protein ACFLT7_08445 [candidate division KSB1 bacterium]